MDQKFDARRITDTSAQDRPLRPWPSTVRRYWPLPTIELPAVASPAWSKAEKKLNQGSYSTSRLRIAEVMGRSLVRDASADNCGIVANSPRLHAVTAGVIGGVAVGPVVNRRELAKNDGPELRSKLAQVESTSAGIEAQRSRAEFDGVLAESAAQAMLYQTRSDHAAALCDIRAPESLACDLQDRPPAQIAEKKRFSVQIYAVSTGVINGELTARPYLAIVATYY